VTREPVAETRTSVETVARFDGKVAGEMTTQTSESLRVLVLAASFRKESLNRNLAALAANVVRASGATVDVATMDELDVPLHHGDLRAERGIPVCAQTLRDRLLATRRGNETLSVHEACVGRVPRRATRRRRGSGRSGRGLTTA
jgi:hypothetical protein